MESEVRSTVKRAFEGCYESRRAAALAGVPLSTVYLWARKDIVTPSISSTRPKLWSYADLMALRIVYWLRHPKTANEVEYKATPMSVVREALNQVANLDIDLWSEDDGVPASPLLVRHDGQIIVNVDGVQSLSSGQGQFDVLDLLGPFDLDGLSGPNLVRPRPHLRIVPGKVSGEPHLARSRVTTQTLAALAQRGYSNDDLAQLYPSEPREALEEAVELEAGLSGHIPSAA